MLLSHDEALTQGWYLLKVKARGELRASSNLENQEFETYCPLFAEVGRNIPLFPGYLFVRLNQNDIDRYHKIRSTRGVSEVVHFNRINRKLYKEGRLSSKECSKLLPSPIPGGDILINQIEAYLLQKKEPDHQEGLGVASLQAGDKVFYDRELFRNLDSVFVKGLNADRGIILIRFIESMRTENGIEESIVAEREMEVPLNLLQSKA